MRRWGGRRGGAGVLVAVVATSLDTAMIAVIDHAVRIPNISLLYLPIILVVAVYLGTAASLVASGLAVLQYDFFLLQPVYTFSIDRAENVLAFGVFVLVAVLTSHLAASARSRAEHAQRRATETYMLYELGQALMSGNDMPHILRIMTDRIVQEFRVDRCAIFVPDGADSLILAAETPQGAVRDRSEQATVLGAFRRGEHVWLPRGRVGGLERQEMYLPLRAADHSVGVMEVGRSNGGALDESERRVLTSIAAQAALLIARAQGEEERHRVALLEEQDRLKSALLNAVSHDLRTPLASIKASATALLLADADWSRDQGREFVQAIDVEADRMNRLVGNLLDVSRIEAGVLRPVLEWYDIGEVVDCVAERVPPILANRPWIVSVQPDIPMVRLDLVRIEELLINLVENASRYSTGDSPVELHAWLQEGLCLAVVDHGRGISPLLKQHVFDAFVQGQPANDRFHGTGLGLAICRGIADAHGGTIEARETAGGGVTMVLTLPPALLDRRVPV